MSDGGNGIVAKLIGKESWLAMSSDVKGDAYEGLLERNAQDVKDGAGQYFTPRPLIQAIVEVIRPALGEVTCDPAAGTGGFLIAAYHYLATRYKPDKAQKHHLRYDALRGMELVEGDDLRASLEQIEDVLGDLQERAKRVS